MRRFGSSVLLNRTSDMSIGHAECPRFESPAGSCWAADGTRACEHACDCMCHWDFDRLRQTIGGLRVIATWALLARRALSDFVTREQGTSAGRSHELHQPFPALGERGGTRVL
jgi:hypothetical protein